MTLGKLNKQVRWVLMQAMAFFELVMFYTTFSCAYLSDSNQVKNWLWAYRAWGLWISVWQNKGPFQLGIF